MYQAHQVEWPKPTRWPRWQFAIAVAVEAGLILGIIGGLLVVGAVAGAALGIEMRP